MTQRYRVTFKCECGEVSQKVMSSPTPDLNKVKCSECKKKNKKTMLNRIGDGPVSEAEAKRIENPVKFNERDYPNTIYKCDDCHSVTRIYQDVGEPNLSACPACESDNVKYKGHISKDIPTASSNRNKCVDKTADIVMQDYKMGNLKDDVKIGESMAPRLGGGAQDVADQMMGMKSSDGMMSVYDANTRRIVKIPSKRNGAALAKRALSGAMRDLKADPVRMLHQTERGHA